MPDRDSPTPCTICGADSRVLIGSVPYCLGCYNHMTDALSGVEPPTNDDYRILALDADGKAVEFAVERFSLGLRSTWTAVEVVAEDDSRRQWGYEGRSASVMADVRDQGQDEALDELMRKVQRVTGHASIEFTSSRPGEVWVTSARRPGGVIYACETGVARIESDADGRRSVVVDGQRLDAEEFLDLLSCFEGFDLWWEVRHATDEVPEWWG